MAPIPDSDPQGLSAFPLLLYSALVLVVGYISFRLYKCRKLRKRGYVELEGVELLPTSTNKLMVDVAQPWAAEIGSPRLGRPKNHAPFRNLPLNSPYRARSLSPTGSMAIKSSSFSNEHFFSTPNTPFPSRNSFDTLVDLSVPSPSIHLHHRTWSDTFHGQGGFLEPVGLAPLPVSVSRVARVEPGISARDDAESVDISTVWATSETQTVSAESVVAKVASDIPLVDLGVSPPPPQAHVTETFVPASPPSPVLVDITVPSSKGPLVQLSLDDDDKSELSDPWDLLESDGAGTMLNTGTMEVPGDAEVQERSVDMMEEDLLEEDLTVIPPNDLVQLHDLGVASSVEAVISSPQGVEEGIVILYEVPTASREVSPAHDDDPELEPVRELTPEPLDIMEGQELSLIEALDEEPQSVTPDEEDANSVSPHETHDEADGTLDVSKVTTMTIEGHEFMNINTTVSTTDVSLLVEHDQPTLSLEVLSTSESLDESEEEEEMFPDPDLLPLDSPTISSPRLHSLSDPALPEVEIEEHNLENSTMRPAWSLRAADAPPLGIGAAREVNGDEPLIETPAVGVPPPLIRQNSLPGEFPESKEPVPQPVVDGTAASSTGVDVQQNNARRRFLRSPIDIALAMQLRPGLGLGADPAWMVRFLMSMFGWLAVLISGSGNYERSAT